MGRAAGEDFVMLALRIDRVGPCFTVKILGPLTLGEEKPSESF